MDDQPSPKILDSLHRYRWSSLGIVGVVALLSVLVALFVRESGSAQTRIVLKAPDKAGVVGVDASSESAFVRYVNQRALFVVSDRVLTVTSSNVANSVPVESLRKQITAKASSNGDSIDITVAAGDSGNSVRIADALTKAYQSESKADVQASAQKILDTLAARRKDVVEAVGPDAGAKPGDPANAAAGQTISDLDKQATQVRVAAEQFGDGVSFVDKASAGASGLLGSLVRDLGIGVALGVLIAAAVAWARADRDRRVSAADELAAATGEPVLAEIETLSDAEVAALKEVGSPPLWPYQFAASGLRTAVDRGVVVVTSSAPGDGGTTSTLQMATAAALSGARVLVVDAAVRTHGLSDALALRYDPHGLTSIAVGAMRTDDCTRVVDLGDRVFLWAIPAGQYQESTLDHFRSSLLQKAVAAMRSAYDLVLIDCASPAIAPEVTPLIRESDGVVVVVRRDRETRAVHRLREQIGLLGGTITGYLFTFAKPRRDAPKRIVRH
ncbi:Chromosome partitioning ATPase, Mrp family, contains Fe-S cluster [Amycolatopsis xylanica]|uniref:Chromosome partitioning ATPase, Mrp family, contains Fe-S cluster n=1 Tax=Amycolatopsis xylanica TaxID=589385 RepID=A0A1H2SP28_9PSEU|nr:AAA family ATPase [Amycolatopsis xylanica]SDW33396.1 Chromosome partitioning ATPase, Mrp family, contains Fe-S cluster [Amycolatopsis xylanica]